MSSAAELLREAAARPFVDEDGNSHRLRLLPPLSAGELRELEAALLPCILPEDARELLAFTRGIGNGPLESVEFAGLGAPFMEEAFPHGVPIAHDGYGNYWMVDLVSSSTCWGPIFFACHDPPVIVYQCADVATFVADLLRLSEAPLDGPLDDVHERQAIEVWRDRSNLLPRDEAGRSEDPVLRQFARSLGAESVVADLRRARTGDGFAWGRFGPQTIVRRAGDDRIFACEPPARTSLFARLFGRG